VGGHSNLNKLSTTGLLIALGIIYGDIGTSPLYVFNSIIANRIITEELVVGTLSLIIWTLTIQTTIKYVIMVLRADNKGEGGIFALFALVRRRKKWLVIPAMIGGAALLSDGIITPPISITSAIEGLRNIQTNTINLDSLHQDVIVYIVLAILALFFFMQQFGTAVIGKFFGPIMTVWFGMIALVGAASLIQELSILKAINPYYAINFLITYKGAFWLLGSVFLCTTGAEALYSDLGHCGRPNIRVSWIFVKTTLLINYFGQGAYLLANAEKLNQTIADNAAYTSALNTGKSLAGLKFDAIHCFYDIIPSWFVIPSIIIATVAAIIASQAMLSGSFTLISEAIRLNLWPKLQIKYPSDAKGQLFIPGINTLLFIGCVFVVLYFRESSKMEHAYGLAIIATMCMTTILFANYLVLSRVKKWWIYLFLVVYIIVEYAFFVALCSKFMAGGYITTLIAGVMCAVMYTWYRARKIKNRYVEFVRLENYIPQIEELSNDKTVPKYASHLVYMTSADNPKELEHKILYSILNRKPKRADIYWFVHVDTVDEPYTCEYSVNHIIPNDIVRVEFKLGFRVSPRINLLFRRVVEDLVTNKEVNITSRYESLERNKVAGDFKFIVMEKYLSSDNDLPVIEKLIMKLYFWIKKISLSEERGFGLDPSYVKVEQFPLIVSPVAKLNLKRVEPR
jgi:KUP system potassium uptake protein